MLAEYSYENPEKNMSFILNPTNAIKLKQSIAALCDSEFNPQGVGVIEVTEKGFGITVCNTKTGTAGNLFLNSSGLINFHCNNPIVGKTINLNQIPAFMNDANDDDTITVFHPAGSTNLSLIFASAPSREFKAEFLETNAEFNKLPNVEISCETGLKSEILGEMIEQLIENGLLVSLDISPKLVSILIGKNNPWICKIKEDDENFEVRILTEEQHHHAWFELKHLEAMRKASTVGPRFHLRILTEPSRNIMMRFNLDEVGDLVFIHNAILIMKNPRKFQIGGDAPDRDAEINRLVHSMYD